MANIFSSAGTELFGGLFGLYSTTPTDPAASEVDPPDYYTVTMTGNTTPVYTSGAKTVYFYDPNGADRQVNPTAGYPEGYEIVIVNEGAYLITFDASGLNAVVEPFGGHRSFFFNGTNWR